MACSITILTLRRELSWAVVWVKDLYPHLQFSEYKAQNLHVRQGEPWMWKGIQVHMHPCRWCWCPPTIVWDIRRHGWAQESGEVFGFELGRRFQTGARTSRWCRWSCCLSQLVPWIKLFWVLQWIIRNAKIIKKKKGSGGGLCFLLRACYCPPIEKLNTNLFIISESPTSLRVR